MHILVTRPEPGGQDLRDRLNALGHVVTLAPLISIEPVVADLPLADVQAIMVTSANAIAAAGSHLEHAKSIPLYAVGEKTARAAREAGFKNVTAGPSDGRALADLMAGSLDARRGAILHLAGDRLAFDAEATLGDRGLAYRKAIVYRSIAAPELPLDVQRLLMRDALDAAIFMSPRTSSIFVKLVRNAGLTAPARRIACICLSQAVAAPLIAEGFGTIAIASHPDIEEVLALTGKISSIRGA